MIIDLEMFGRTQSRGMICLAVNGGFLRWSSAPAMPSGSWFSWEEPRLEQKIRYFAETEPGGKTQEEASEELWDLFANDIVRRTIEGFGTVTGSSPRAVPKALDRNPPPKYPNTAPF